MNEQELNVALADRELMYQGVIYRFTGARVRRPPTEPNPVVVEFSAARADGVGETIRGILHVSRDSFEDREYLIAMIDHTVMEIVDGRLPPGTIQPL